MYNINDTVSKEFILERIPQEDIFQKYLGVIPELGISFTNPWRDDESPDCRFYWDDRYPPMLKFHDIAMRWNWDCFNIVQISHGNCSFQEALNIIAKDFNISKKDINLDLLTKRDIIAQLNVFQSNPSKIEVRIRSWYKMDIEYWNKYFIDLDTLSLYNVYPIDMAWLDGRVVYQFRDLDIGYAYHLGNDDWKLYFPNRTKTDAFRFLHNNPKRLQGYRQLDPIGNILIDTKSLKDVMTLRKFGINAVAPMTETIPISDKAFEHLNSRFTNILVLKDRDRTGDRMAIYMRKNHPVITLRFPKDAEKDFSDNLHKHGWQYMSDWIEHTADTITLL